jgi:hypothetical protein
MQSPCDKTVFARTQIAKYLSSLLLCNLIQAVGGLLNIAWLVENHIYVGVTCTAQAALKQIGNVRGPFLTDKSDTSHFSWCKTGPAIFTFVIAAQTFCLLFLRREWTDCTCHIIHIVSWAFLVFELCIENLAGTKPEKGPRYGISTAGYWCWISPKYQIERYTSDYPFMIASATFCLILYSLVFFRLRGNISVSGYIPSFHPRPNNRISSTSSGALVVTSDRHVESHLDRVAKRMLWYPIVYIVIVIPMVATRYSAFSSLRDYPEVTFTFASIFNLHGFFNTVLFCTTRNILPGSWRQRFGPEPTQGTRHGAGTVSTGTVLDICSP